MKIFTAIAIFVFFLASLNGCAKQVPTYTADTPTPNVTMTVEALQTAGLTAQQSATMQAAEATVNASIYQMATAIALATAGPTAQMVATLEAQIRATETANMNGFIATQTAIIAAMQTAVVLTQTKVALAATQTVSVVMATQTRVAAIATQTASAIMATQTATIAGVPTAVAQEAIFRSSEEISVPGGTFYQYPFNHTISQFKICKYELTYNLWFIVYKWAITHGYAFSSAGAEGKDGIAGNNPTDAARFNPVTAVNWRDAIVWCNAYSEKSGYIPVYYADAGFISALKDSTSGAYAGSVNTAPGSFDSPYVNWSANGYRLPTEGEWQYAASYIDGTSWLPDNYASGAPNIYYDIASDRTVCWFYDNSDNTSHIEGLKAPNALGIYDMSGNVWEWCWDWMDVYPFTAQTDYRGPLSGTERVIRGGYYFSTTEYIQVGVRFQYIPYVAGARSVGFRFARSN
jgi:formylglycine-generating enzyme required for sulfatase activity